MSYYIPVILILGFDVYVWVGADPNASYFVLQTDLDVDLLKTNVDEQLKVRHLCWTFSILFPGVITQQRTKKFWINMRRHY